MADSRRGVTHSEEPESRAGLGREEGTSADQNSPSLVREKSFGSRKVSCAALPPTFPKLPAHTDPTSLKTQLRRPPAPCARTCHQNPLAPTTLIALPHRPHAPAAGPSRLWSSAEKSRKTRTLGPQTHTVSCKLGKPSHNSIGQEVSCSVRFADLELEFEGDWEVESLAKTEWNSTSPPAPELYGSSDRSGPSPGQQGASERRRPVAVGGRGRRGAPMTDKLEIRGWVFSRQKRSFSPRQKKSSSSAIASKMPALRRFASVTYVHAFGIESNRALW